LASISLRRFCAWLLKREVRDVIRAFPLKSLWTSHASLIHLPPTFATPLPLLKAPPPPNAYPPFFFLSVLYAAFCAVLFDFGEHLRGKSLFFTLSPDLPPSHLSLRLSCPLSPPPPPPVTTVPRSQCQSFSSPKSRLCHVFSRLLFRPSPRQLHQDLSGPDGTVLASSPLGTPALALFFIQPIRFIPVHICFRPVSIDDNCAAVRAQ